MSDIGTDNFFSNVNIFLIEVTSYLKSVRISLQKTDYRIPNDHSSVVNRICCYLLQKLTYQ